MGVFDQHIEWLRGRKAIAEQDVEDYIAGAAAHSSATWISPSYSWPARNRTYSSSRR